MGYYRAGFDVVGVDIEPQPHYPFAFRQGDALAVLRDDYLAGYGDMSAFDAIHASPPCQHYSKLTKHPENHPDLVAPVRELLQATGLPWVMENVPQAPLIDPVILCGSMFGLQVRRHRGFESSEPLKAPECNHRVQGHVVGVYGHPGGSETRNPHLRRHSVAEWRDAMGIEWMTARELKESIPPAYTEFIGTQLLHNLTT